MHTSVLVFDYRGYGRSAGTPSEDGVFADTRAARRWLAARANVPESAIVLAGRSLGGGVAVDLAARDGARGLILESTFSSLPETAAVTPGRRSPVRHSDAHPLRLGREDSELPRPAAASTRRRGPDRAARPWGGQLFDAANEP